MGNQQEAMPRVKRIPIIGGESVYRVSLSTFPRLRMILSQKQAETLADELSDKVFD